MKALANYVYSLCTHFYFAVCVSNKLSHPEYNYEYMISGFKMVSSILKCYETEPENTFCGSSNSTLSMSWLPTTERSPSVGHMIFILKTWSTTSWGLLG